MTVYVALLRGINVGGKIVKMERLRGSFQALGFGHVKTYVNSGNAVFDASGVTASILSDRIEERISRDFGFPITVVLRTSHDLEEIVRDNPFLREKEIDHSKLHVTFMSEQPSKAVLGKLDSLSGDLDRYQVKGGEVYLYCPAGYGRTKLSNAAFERLLSVKATTRNWRTVNSLTEMSMEREPNW